MKKQLTIFLLLSLTAMMIPQETVEADIYREELLTPLEMNNTQFISVWFGSNYGANITIVMYNDTEMVAWIKLTGYTSGPLAGAGCEWYRADHNYTEVWVKFANLGRYDEVHYIDGSMYFGSSSISNTGGTFNRFTIDRVSNYGSDDKRIILSWMPIEIPTTTNTVTETETEISTSTMSTTETSTETQTETNTEIEVTTEVITNVDNITNTYDATETWWEGTTITDSVTRTFDIFDTEYTTIVVTSTEDDTQIGIVLGGLGIFLIAVISSIRYFKKSLKDKPHKEIWKGSDWCGGCGQDNETGSGWCVNCGTKLGV